MMRMMLAAKTGLYIMKYSCLVTNRPLQQTLERVPSVTKMLNAYHI